MKEVLYAHLDGLAAVSKSCQLRTVMSDRVTCARLSPVLPPCRMRRDVTDTLTQSQVTCPSDMELCRATEAANGEGLPWGARLHRN